MLHSEQAIGIFDSGVGGLTVASAIRQLLPGEKMIYFGDTAHLPYGDKSSESIMYYSRHIADFLLEQHVKVILIACNTASAFAYKHLQEYVGDRAIVLNVIDPVVEYIQNKFKKSKIGVIGTKGTIRSGTYEKEIMTRTDDIKVISKPTPLFVPMIEEGFVYDDISNAIIRSYLSQEDFRGIDALILGCTHYPIIKNQIRKFFDFKVDVVDSAKVVARHLKQKLEEHNLLSSEGHPTHEFFISDYTEYFEAIARMFFEEKINLSKKDLWT